MSSLARRRPAFLLNHRPADSAAVYDFNAAKAAAVAATPHDGPVRFDDDESGIALAGLPLHDDAEASVIEVEAPIVGTAADGETVSTEKAANNDTTTGSGAFKGAGVEPMETGRRTEEDRKAAIKKLRHEVKALTAAAKDAATKAAKALAVKTKAANKLLERETVAAALTGTAKVREEAKIGTARLDLERATHEHHRLQGEADAAERDRAQAENDLNAKETAEDTPEDASPQVKYLHHCIADTYYRPGGVSGGDKTSVDEVFYKYDSIYWEPQSDVDAEDRATKFAVAHAAKVASDRLVFSMIKFSSMGMLKDYAKPAPGKGKIYIQLLNAVLEVRKEADGKVTVYAHKPAPHFGTTSCIQAPIDWKRSVGPLDKKGSGIYTPAPLRKTSLFGEYIYTSCEDEEDMVCFVGEAMGSTVTGDKTWRKAIVLVGDTGTGKSTFQALLTRVFHPKWAAVEPEKWADNFGMENMVGKTLYVASETEYFPSREFKAVVASDMVPVTRKGKPTISMIPRGRLLIACNLPPRYRDDPSGAIADRLCCIPWDVQAHTKPGGVNTDLVEQIMSDPVELLQMVDFVVNGVVRLVQRGKFMPDSESPVRAQALKARVISDNNPVSSFMDAYNVRLAKDGEMIPKSEVYPLYVKHCEQTGVKPQFRLIEGHFWRNVYGFVGKTWPRHKRNDIDYVPLLVRGIKPV